MGKLMGEGCLLRVILKFLTIITVIFGYVAGTFAEAAKNGKRLCKRRYVKSCFR